MLADVRGDGLFLGLECAVWPNGADTAARKDTATAGSCKDTVGWPGAAWGSGPRPAPRLAAALVEAAKARRVLLSADGPVGHVVKIKPPLTFEKIHADQLVSALRCE